MSQQENEKEEAYVDMSVTSGVNPIELQFDYVCDKRSLNALALRSSILINSVLLGTLKEDDYKSVLSKSPVGKELFNWGLQNLAKLLKHLEEDGTSMEWISYKCPTSLLQKIDLYDLIKTALEKYEIKHPERLCIEFEDTFLDLDLSIAQKTLADLNILNVRTLMTGCASKRCPIHLLSVLPMQMVILDQSITTQLTNEKDQKSANALIEYLLTLNVKPILSEIMDDNQIQKLNFVDAYGFVTSKYYVGKATHTVQLLTVDDLTT